MTPIEIEALLILFVVLAIVVAVATVLSREDARGRNPQRYGHRESSYS